MKLMNRNNLRKNNTKQSHKSKEAQKSNWVEEIKKSFNKNRTKRIAVV